MEKTQCAWYKPEKEGKPKDKSVFACEYELSAMFRMKARAKNSLGNKSYQSHGRSAPSALQEMAESGLDREPDKTMMTKVRINWVSPKNSPHFCHMWRNLFDILHGELENFHQRMVEFMFWLSGAFSSLVQGEFLNSTSRQGDVLLHCLPIIYVHGLWKSRFGSLCHYYT